MSSTQEILSIENLSIAFGGPKEASRAVNDISFKLCKGETLGIVGESGSGKSVTALSILRLLPSAGHYPSGKILFESNSGNVNILDLDQNDLRKIRGNEIAMIFQNPMNSLNPSHRCGKQVQEAILLHQKISQSEAKKQVLELFQKVELADAERIYASYPHQLSGGQIQRIMIAMAVSCKPKILVADEPTTALDVTVQKKIIELLAEIKNEHDTSIIFISHDLGVVKEIADRVVVMYKGEIVEQGLTKEVFKNPEHPYTKGLIACRPPLGKRLKRLPTIETFLSGEKISNDLYRGIEVKEFRKNLKEIETRSDLLLVNNLSKYYPKKRNFFGKVTQWTKAVNDVSFKMKKGETLGLVGESGSGKSTLGKTILKLIPATSGNVVFKNQSVFDISSNELKKLRQNFQIIFQNPYASLNPRMKIGKAIMEPMTVHNLHKSKNQRKEKTMELLELVGLESDHFERYPHQFSGGQRQRICIARTLSLNPEFIVCDECVSALDVSVQAQILNLLSDLKDKLDLSYIFISHDLSVVKHISDHIMVMQHGKIVETNDAESLFSNPQMNYTKNLLEAIPKA